MEAEREVQDSIGLDEIVESRLRKLITRIAECSALDIEPELKSLAQLIDDYNRKDELLETLLDSATTEGHRKQLKETLEVVTRNRVELEILRRKSHKLLESSIQQYLESSRRLYRIRNGPEYSPELCGYCKGFGRSNLIECPACKGKRLVVVHQPAMICPRCKGNGNASSADRVATVSALCMVCRGKGWAFTRRNKISTQDQKNTSEA